MAVQCSKCGKTKDKSADAGSLTSYLWAELTCDCDRVSGKRNNSKLCPKCHRIIPDIKRVGSLTAFIFKDLRCECKDRVSSTAIQKSMATRYVNQAAQVKRQKTKATALATRPQLSAKAAGFIQLAQGQVVGGNYELLSLAGQGGMGMVYKARHLSLNREAAVKFLSPSIVSQATWYLFQKEAKIISSLSHPTICQVYDLGIHNGYLPFYAMDFIKGSTLEELITKFGPFSVGATIEIFLKVLEGLSYAHRRNIVHKDIKPANIMIGRQAGGTMQVHILDFGIAELAEQSLNSKTDQKTEIAGSAAYMSTEALEGKSVDKTSDIYSIGCSIFETLTGSMPYEAESFGDLLELHKSREAPLLSERTGINYPLELEAVVKKCLHQSKDKRYQSASELAIDLQRILDKKELQFARTEQLMVSAPTIARPATSKTPLLISAVVLLTTTIAIGAWLLGKDSTNTQKFLKTNDADLTVAHLPYSLKENDEVATKNNQRISQKKCFSSEMLGKHAMRLTLPKNYIFGYLQDAEGKRTTLKGQPIIKLKKTYELQPLDLDTGFLDFLKPLRIKGLILDNQEVIEPLTELISKKNEIDNSLKIANRSDKERFLKKVNQLFSIRRLRFQQMDESYRGAIGYFPKVEKLYLTFTQELPPSNCFSPEDLKVLRDNVRYAYIAANSQEQIGSTLKQFSGCKSLSGIEISSETVDETCLQYLPKDGIISELCISTQQLNAKALLDVDRSLSLVSLTIKTPKLRISDIEPLFKMGGGGNWLRLTIEYDENQINQIARCDSKYRCLRNIDIFNVPNDDKVKELEDWAKRCSIKATISKSEFPANDEPLSSTIFL